MCQLHSRTQPPKLLMILMICFLTSISGYGQVSKKDTTYYADIRAFQGELKGSDFVLVEWTTLKEKGVDSFELEKSVDGSFFFPIDTLGGAYYSDFSLRYNYADFEISADSCFYRLKEIYQDGRTHTSNPILVKTDHTLGLEITFIDQEPFVDSFNVFMVAKRSQAFTVLIYNEKGEEVFRDFYHTDVGENVYEFNKGYQIADGNYALVLMNLKNQMAIEPISKYTPPELPDNLEGQDGKSRD